VNGLLVDLRDMPREVQEIAFEDGLIPYIPADRKERRLQAFGLEPAFSISSHNPRSEIGLGGDVDATEMDRRSGVQSHVSAFFSSFRRMRSRPGLQASGNVESGNFASHVFFPPIHCRSVPGVISSSPCL